MTKGAKRGGKVTTKNNGSVKSQRILCTTFSGVFGTPFFYVLKTVGVVTCHMDENMSGSFNDPACGDRRGVPAGARLARCADSPGARLNGCDQSNPQKNG